MHKIRIVIIDDSALSRTLIEAHLKPLEDIEIVGTTRDPFEGRDLVFQEKPDLLLLDIQLSRMDGLELIAQIMETSPLPIIVFSSLVTGQCSNSQRALELGVIHVFEKPLGDFNNVLPPFMPKIYKKIQTTSKVSVMKRHPSNLLKESAQIDPNAAKIKIISIGASTGGTEALVEILSHLPRNIPPIIITQHMMPGHIDNFAQQLDRQSRLDVRMAVDGEILKSGVALIAPDEVHLTIKREKSQYIAIVKEGPKVCRHLPSVDQMFHSVAQWAGINSLGILLTGMGKDGAAGLLEVSNEGSKTICQNEETCTVYGMPRVAIENGAAQIILPLDQIAEAIIELSK
ncbi:chemotaxis-specific protein-glutamate methyltransferase CheB [bacterium]|nr:chemotaxis-specific protein-glutamate methyltransferase CheB [bacterium]